MPTTRTLLANDFRCVRCGREETVVEPNFPKDFASLGCVTLSGTFMRGGVEGRPGDPVIIDSGDLCDDCLFAVQDVIAMQDVIANA